MRSTRRPTSALLQSLSLLLLASLSAPPTRGGSSRFASALASSEAEIGGDGSVVRLDGSSSPELVPSQFSATVINNSLYRSDVYWDDGKYGVIIATVEIGGSAILNTYAGHGFFVTRHGVREGLHDPKTGDRVAFSFNGPSDGAFEIGPDSSPSDDLCTDRFAFCDKNAKGGGCEQSPGWMIVHCCESCADRIDSRRLIDPSVRCDRDFLNTTEAAWGPGDLNRLFERWTTDPEFERLGPRVLSGPAKKDGRGPWVIEFENFASDEEVSALIKGGQMEGFDRSTDQGKLNAAGEQEKVVSTSRTSSNAWCMSKCESLPGVRSITSKIEKVTGIPKSFYESFQILDYEKGQFYRSHHDSSQKDDSSTGPRILTFFLYLSDVEEGGGTKFNQLGLEVKPKRGKALIWPSVLDSDPGLWDGRMVSEGITHYCPVDRRPP